jgi:hypothetical protein
VVPQELIRNEEAGADVMSAGCFVSTYLEGMMWFQREDNAYWKPKICVPGRDGGGYVGSHLPDGILDAEKTASEK